MKIAVQTSKETRFIEHVSEVEVHIGTEYKLIVTEKADETSIQLTYPDGMVMELESIITAHKVDKG